MADVSAFRNQIQNRNFLSPAGFQFVVSKNRKIDFFATNANLPTITLGNAVQTSYTKFIDVPGDIVTYDDLEFSFLVDEDLENYMALHNWITGLGFPESPQQFKDLITDDTGNVNLQQQFSDCSLIILNSNYNPKFQVKFIDAYPYSLSSLDFNSQLSGEEFFTATASFKYSVYEITDLKGNKL